MLAAVAARLRDRTDLVWVDLGGGTGVRCLLPCKAPVRCMQQAVAVVPAPFSRTPTTRRARSARDSRPAHGLLTTKQTETILAQMQRGHC